MNADGVGGGVIGGGRGCGCSCAYGSDNGGDSANVANTLPIVAVMR